MSSDAFTDRVDFLPPSAERALSALFLLGDGQGDLMLMKWMPTGSWCPHWPRPEGGTITKDVGGRDSLQVSLASWLHLIFYNIIAC